MNKNNNIEAKLFTGFILNSDIRMQLNQNGAWKEKKLINEQELVEVAHQDKNYIGLFISNGQDYELIKENGKRIRSLLQAFCPTLNLDKQALCIFPQIFIS